MDKPKKKKRIWIIVIAVLLVALTAAVFGVKSCAAKQAEIMQEMLSGKSTHVVARGTLEKTITASGTLGTDDTYIMTLPDGILVDDILVKVGDAVEEGQAIADLNPLSVKEQLASLSRRAREEDNKLSTAGSEDSIVAPAKGRIKYQPVQEGDDVLEAMKRYGVLAILSTDGYMRLTIDTEETLTPGSRMEVTWDGGSATSIVERQTRTGYVILGPDGRAPYQGEASLVDDGRVIGSGTLEINMPSEVVAYDGVIRTVRYHLNESVPDGRELYELKDPPVAIAFASRFAARSKVITLYKQLIALSEYNQVLAPCDGVITEISIKKGATTGTTANSDVRSTAFTFGTGGANTLSVNVDELDILSVVLGQKAEISMDALPDTVLEGEVTRIMQAGKKENSIATFPVEIKLDGETRLMSGMNGTATILVERAEDVLLVPLEAVEEDAEGEFVNVVDAAGQNVRTKIVTGRSDSQMVEVLEGLAEGDTVSFTSQDMAAALGNMAVTTVG